MRRTHVIWTKERWKSGRGGGDGDNEDAGTKDVGEGGKTNFEKGRSSAGGAVRKKGGRGEKEEETGGGRGVGGAEGALPE